MTPVFPAGAKNFLEYAGGPVTGGPGRGALPSGTGRRRAWQTDHMAAARTSDIRAWAQANGHAVGDRGRLPSSVIAAHAAAGSPTSSPAAPARRRKAPRAAGPGRSSRRSTTATSTAAARDAAPGAPAELDALSARLAIVENQLTALITRLDELPAPERPSWRLLSWPRF